MKPKTTTWRPFSEARAFVHQLGLKSKDKWKEYSKSGERPHDIPSNPNQVYKSEFKGFGDWLGTGTIATFNRYYRPFTEARAFVHKLGLKNIDQWREYCKSGKKPEDIPTMPERYKSDYKGMGDWLGTGNVAASKRQFLLFTEARSYVRSLKLKNQDAWLDYCKSGQRPDNIPSNPDNVYLGEFKSYGDWLGNENISTWKRTYRPFTEARIFVHALEFKNSAQWLAYCRSGKKPPDIPLHPKQVYRSQYKDMYDWLGTGRTRHKRPFAEYLSFTEARAFVQTQGLKSHDDWLKYCRSIEKPKYIPSRPEQVYRTEYKGMKDWLGVVDKWNNNTLLVFLHDLQPQLSHLSNKDLVDILKRDGALGAFCKVLGGATPKHILNDLLNNVGRELEQALCKTMNENFEAHVENTPGEAQAEKDMNIARTIQDDDKTFASTAMYPASMEETHITTKDLGVSSFQERAERREEYVTYQEEEDVSERTPLIGAIKILYCYAHEDELLLNKLKTHLRPLQRQGLVDVWHDRDINAGDEWEQEIDNHLNKAQIILLLISPNFMDSDYCYGIEMKKALERHEQGEARVIPIILEYIDWQIDPLRKLRALPTDGRPIMGGSWHNPHQAFFDVAEGIRKLVEKLRENKQANSKSNIHLDNDLTCVDDN